MYTNRLARKNWLLKLLKNQPKLGFTKQNLPAIFFYSNPAFGLVSWFAVIRDPEIYILIQRNEQY
jgi:hypothetical protein